MDELDSDLYKNEERTHGSNELAQCCCQIQPELIPVDSERHCRTRQKEEEEKEEMVV